MRIAHVIPQLANGGAEVFVAQLAVQQAREGHHVTLVHLHGHHETFERFPFREQLAQHVALYHCTSRRKLLPWAQDAALAGWNHWLAAWQPQVIHSHLFEADFLAHSRILPRTAFVTHIHGPVPEWEQRPQQSLRTVFINRLERLLVFADYRKAGTWFVANSAYMGQYARQHLPAFTHPRIAVMANAIDLNRFRNLNPSRGGPVLRLVTTGTLIERKNHLFLLEVVRYLHDHHLPCRLQILGHGPLAERLAQRIEALQLTSWVRLEGSVAHVEDYLAQADLYVHAARPEPFGLAILEAMAAGLPVVILNGLGTQDLVQNEVQGFVVEHADVAAFAERVLQLKQNPNLYERMATAARQTASYFGIEAYSRRLFSLYEQASKQTAAGG